ncbi:hypothetical protein DASC09_063270 [Saccharomycopsis crataegensis]|uniref:PI31 proteasome regulator C-terminal domain-containing protein n=1 Tax=Saccharomycopsis crataegensis TaxID=43959 RepID=A0AAV5QVM3_9ASCO|nr:hypothetical protein DASC09_063270 [Saccharomycopsis crataegensis]
MNQALKDLSDFIRDWVYLDLKLNSTIQAIENSSVYIHVENDSKFIVNKISNDNFLINVLYKDRIIVTAQLKLSDYVSNISDPETKEREKFNKYLSDTISGKYYEALNGNSQTVNEKAVNKQTESSKLKESFGAINSNIPDKSTKVGGTDLRSTMPKLPTAPTPPSSKTEVRPSNPNDPPGFEDEYKLLPQNSSYNSPKVSGSIGEKDLDPMGIGKYPVMKPYIDPLGSGSSGSGGMHPTFNDPLFHPENRNSGNGSLQRPPGARWSNPMFGTDDPEDIERMGQGLPGTSGLRGPANNGSFGFPKDGNTGNGGFGFGFGGNGAGFGSGGSSGGFGF